MLPNVTITPAAAKFINRIVRFSGLPAGAGLRLAVTPGGCSGYSSEFSAEAAPQGGEQLLEEFSILHGHVLTLRRLSQDAAIA